MRMTRLPLLLAASLAFASPVAAQTDLENIVSGIAQSLISQERDRAAYIEAQQLNTVRAYRSYLTQFPKGAFRSNAERALVKLGASVNPPVDQVPVPVTPPVGSAASVEASLGLTRNQRIGIQKQLTVLGYPTGVADGLWGSNTRAAIKRWQTANKLTATGYFTNRQVTLIAQQAATAGGTGAGGTGSGGVAVSDDVIEERLLSLTYAERREVQRRLTLLGYSTGGIDGSFGQGTRRALATWQRDERLRASGYLTADQLRELRLQTGG